MKKPIIFFSHSNKDRELILPIKNKIEDITSKVVEIFMSSDDGQSLPYGHNWAHKIDERLRSTQIMFVFVTTNSINSAWIYFEAGYAYSKGIEVVPIGLGVDVGHLKPPLNLLQGFNATSADSLNNIVSIINKKINTHFTEQFTNADFQSVNDSIITMEKGLELLTHWGLDNIYLLRSDTREERTKLLETTSEYIDICGIGSSVLRNHPDFNRIIEPKIMNNLKIRILVVSPDSEYTKQLDRNGGRSIQDGAVRTQLLDLFDWVDDMKKIAPDRENVSVKIYDNFPLDFYFRYDNTIFIGPYMFGKISPNTITMKFKGNATGFKYYTEYFNDLWNDPNFARVPDRFKSTCLV